LHLNPALLDFAASNLHTVFVPFFGRHTCKRTIAALFLDFTPIYYSRILL